VFDAFDLNRNGWIDFNEFLAGVSFTNSSDVEKRLHIAFRVYDLDKNGYITKKEMEKVILAIYKMINLTDKSKDNNPKVFVYYFKFFDTVILSNFRRTRTAPYFIVFHRTKLKPHRTIIIIKLEYGE
jgi:hypothetical protein